MFDYLLDAVGKIPFPKLDEFVSTVWKAFAEGSLTEAQVSLIAEAAQNRRKPVERKPRARSIFPSKRLRPRPDNNQRLDRKLRRRKLAASGPMPNQMACNFTTGELAVLTVVMLEVRSKGYCDLTMKQLADRAGVGETTARNALRQATLLGYITVEERRVMFEKNKPNLVKIVSKEWLSWIGFKKTKATATEGFNRLTEKGSKSRKESSTGVSANIGVAPPRAYRGRLRGLA